MTPIPLRPVPQLDTRPARTRTRRLRRLVRWLEFTPWAYWVESYRQTRIAQRKST